MSLTVVADGVGRWTLAHGQDPVDLLAEQGLVGRPASSSIGADGDVEIHYEVAPVAAAGSRRGSGVASLGGSAGVRGEAEDERRVRRLQRLGAYAIVAHDGRLLMSQLSDNVVGGAGLWTLPGGGVDPGEAPLDALVREVHEETGQRVVAGDLVQVQSAHRVGPDASGGRGYEDFQAVRLIHLAHCPEPGPARVIEVDGSTGAAAWVPLDEVPGLPLGSMMAPAWPWVPGSESYPL